MTLRNILAHLVGILAIAAAGLWLYADVRPDGHVEMTTAVGIAALALIGGWLIDKAETKNLVAFLASSLRQFFTLPGSGNNNGGAS